MKWKDYTFNVSSDLFRYCGNTDIASFIKSYFSIPGFKYSIYMRSAKYIRSKGKITFPIYVLLRMILMHYEYKFGISIPYNTDIGPGLYIGHFGGIIVNPDAIIGRNCNINQEVTIGAAYGGKFPGNPIIMNNVYLAPGSKIIGGVTIGNNAAVGANCVVTKPVPDNGIMVGIPGEVVSLKGSGAYVVNTIKTSDNS